MGLPKELQGLVTGTQGSIRSRQQYKKSDHAVVRRHASASAMSLPNSAKDGTSGLSTEGTKSWCLSCKSGDPFDGGMVVPVNEMCPGYCTPAGYCGEGTHYRNQTG